MGIEIKWILVEELSPILGIEKNDIHSLLEVPPGKNLGDFAIPCFSLAKSLGKNPAVIASEFESLISQEKSVLRMVKSSKAQGPYLNLFIKKNRFVDLVSCSINREDSFSDIKKLGQGKTVVIDYSSPNIAKPFGIGHLRSTVIGNSLKKIFDFMGYKVIGINHLGDWGTQFGKLITAFKLWGNEKELEYNPVNYLYSLYVKFHSEAKKNPQLEDQARTWFARLEKGDGEALRMWEHFRDLSIEEFKKLYKRLGVEFEYYTGESFYLDMLDETIDFLLKSGITRESEGALIVPLKELPPAMLRKRDGTTLYLTRDLAAVLYRHRKFNFDLALYVVGSPQSLHFKQLFAILEKLGFPWWGICHHVPFGHVRFSDRSMSTRKGNIIFLEEVLDRAVSLALKIIEEKNPSLDNKEEVAEAVGVGSIIFNDLKNYRIKDVIFNWEEVLNFDGETGPYLQYTHARICSLLERYSNTYGEIVYRGGLPFSEEAYPLAVMINDFEKHIERASLEFEPSILSRYLLSLCSEFNSFYNAHRVISDDQKLSLSRALIVKGVQKVLRTGLELLGIKAVEKM